MPSGFRARGESALVERPPHPDPLPASGEREQKTRTRPYLGAYGGKPGHDYEEMVQYDRTPDYLGSAASCGTSSSFGATALAVISVIATVS